MSNPLSIEPGAHNHLMWRAVVAEVQLYWVDRRLDALLAQDDQDDCGSFYTAKSSLESWETARSRLSATSAGRPTSAGKSPTLNFYY